MREPGVRAFFFEPADYVAECVKILELLAALFAIHHDQRHAPETLARNAPVGALGNHALETLLAPLGSPFHFADFVERVLAKMVVFEVDEPLLGGAKNNGDVATPAVRITVLQFSLADQSAARFEELDDERVGFEDSLAFVFGQAFDETAVVIEGSVCVDAVFLTGA